MFIEGVDAHEDNDDWRLGVHDQSKTLINRKTGPCQHVRICPTLHELPFGPLFNSHLVVDDTVPSDGRHYGPLSFSRSFYAEMLKKSGESGGQTTELNVDKKHTVEKGRSIWHMNTWS